MAHCSYSGVIKRSHSDIMTDQSHAGSSIMFLLVASLCVNNFLVQFSFKRLHFAVLLDMSGSLLH